MNKENSISIRPIAIEDALIVLKWENNPENWEFSDTTSPYTLIDMVKLVEDLRNIRAVRQGRWMIDSRDRITPLGTVDLFDINFEKGFASVGVLIAEKEDRKKGYASLALELVGNEAVELGLSMLRCTIHETNISSIKLFEKNGFEIKSVQNTEDVKEPNYIKEILLEKWLKK